MMIYEFVGGKYDGQDMTREQVEAIGNGSYTPNYTEARLAGRLVPRKELDEQPKVDGYIGPMYNGFGYLINGEFKRSWSCTLGELEGKEPIDIIRYESPKVYDMFSN